MVISYLYSTTAPADNSCSNTLISMSIRSWYKCPIPSSEDASLSRYNGGGTYGDGKEGWRFLSVTGVYIIGDGTKPKNKNNLKNLLSFDLSFEITFFLQLMNFAPLLM